MDTPKNYLFQFILSLFGAVCGYFISLAITCWGQSINPIQFSKDIEFESGDDCVAYYSVFNSSSLAVDDVHVEIKVDKRIPDEAYMFIPAPGVSVRLEKKDTSQTQNKRFKAFKDNSNGDCFSNMVPGEQFGFAITVKKEFDSDLIKSLEAFPGNIKPSEYTPRKIHRTLKTYISINLILFVMVGFFSIYSLVNFIRWLRISNIPTTDSTLSADDISTIKDIVAGYKAHCDIDEAEAKTENFIEELKRKGKQTRRSEKSDESDN